MFERFNAQRILIEELKAAALTQNASSEKTTVELERERVCDTFLMRSAYKFVCSNS